MLSMTRNASNVLDAIREQQGVPEAYVVRVFPNPTIEGLQVQISFAPEPAEGDKVTETTGTTLCVDQDLVEPLADAVIDARTTAAGPELVLREESAEGSGPESNGNTPGAVG